jgi:hypothetical protein
VCVGVTGRHHQFSSASEAIEDRKSDTPNAPPERTPVQVTAEGSDSLRESVTTSIHKLTAGLGYDYLTRQMAALDSTEKGHTSLAAYYAERGETPGLWIGSGMKGIDGLAAGDPVTAEQMRALFGCGLHPLAELRVQQLEGPDLTERDYLAVTRLGVPFKIDHDVSTFRREVAKRIAGINEAAGLPGDWPVPAADRAQVRTEVAREFFIAQHGREPTDARELAGQIAEDSRPRTQTVAGYDLTFSPVKSVSALWAVADQSVSAVIERAHRDAVQDALSFIEGHALFTRTGPQGIRQVDMRGLVAAAFTHRDSRAGDPDLHTPMSRLRTRCRPSTAAGFRSMGGCCSKPTWPPRRPTTLHWSSTSAIPSESASRNAPAATRPSGRSERSSASTRD